MSRSTLCTYQYLAGNNFKQKKNKSKKYISANFPKLPYSTTFSKKIETFILFICGFEGLTCSWIENQLSNYHFLIKKVFHSTKMELSSFVSFEVLISTYWAFYDIELKRRSRQATISFLSSSALFPLFVPNSICGRHFFFAAQNSTATPFLHTSQDFPDAFLA